MARDASDRPALTYPSRLLVPSPESVRQPMLSLPQGANEWIQVFTNQMVSDEVGFVPDTNSDTFLALGNSVTVAVEVVNATVPHDFFLLGLMGSYDGEAWEGLVGLVPPLNVFGYATCVQTPLLHPYLQLAVHLDFVHGHNFVLFNAWAAFSSQA